jgi:hypothetical protein
MATIRLTLTGRTPLLQHNARLSDPDDPITREIKTITSKRTKTEDDRRAIERLEWYGGLYLADGIDGPAHPTTNVRRCLIAAGTITKEGKQVERALTFATLYVPLASEGPRDIDRLFASERHASRLPVRVNQSRTWRVRPSFFPWSLVADAFLLEDVMDFDALVRVAQRAGEAEGLGDNRKNGYGRFTVEIVRV